MESLNKAITRTLERFQKLFDNQLIKGLYKLIGCTHAKFIEEESEKHLKKILLAQYYLQKQIEKALSKEEEQTERDIFLHVLSESSCICVALALSYQRQSEIFNQRSSSIFLHLAILRKALSLLLCGATKTKRQRPFLSSRTEKKLKKYIHHSVISCTPPVFWSYNHEQICTAIPDGIKGVEAELIEQRSFVDSGFNSDTFRYIFGRIKVGISSGNG